MKKKELAQIEKDILWILIKRDTLTSHISMHGNEELVKKYNPPEIDSSWETLLAMNLVRGSSRGGGIADASAYLKIKNLFNCKFFWYKIWRGIANFWKYIWKHFIFTVLVAFITSMVTNSLVTNYILNELGILN